MTVPWSKRSKKAMLEAGFSEEQNMNARRMVLSEMLMLALFILKLATAAPGGDDDDDKEEDPVLGAVYYFAMRTLYEQEALLWLPETFVQSGQLLDLVPVGGAAINDLWTLTKEGVGAMVGDEDAFYKRNDKNGRYEAGDAKFWKHLERLTPYLKNWWGIQNGYAAAENYEFGRKLRTR